jgi:single-stranded-DNA-specific exonuclease
MNKDIFLNFGGHELAGGFSVSHKKIHLLEEELLKAYDKAKKEIFISTSSVLIDKRMSLADVSLKTYEMIERLAPFGIGNPKPVFLFEGVKIEKIKKFGKNGSGEHLEITFSDGGGKKATAISFFSNIDSFGNQISEGLRINLLATFDLSRFRGREELRLRIVDII